MLRLRASGFTNKEVGCELGIAEGTVKQLTHSAYARLGADGLVEAMRAMGWVVVQ